MSQVRPLGSDPAALGIAANVRCLLSQLSPAERSVHTSQAERSLHTSQAERSVDGSGGSASEAAADALASSEAIAARLIRRLAAEPRAASALACARVDTDVGLRPLQDAVLRGAFPQLRCCSLPLPYLRRAPHSRHLNLLSEIGCVPVA